MGWLLHRGHYCPYFAAFWSDGTLAVWRAVLWNSRGFVLAPPAFPNSARPILLKRLLRLLSPLSLARAPRASRVSQQRAPCITQAPTIQASKDTLLAVCLSLETTLFGSKGRGFFLTATFCEHVRLGLNGPKRKGGLQLPLIRQYDWAQHWSVHIQLRWANLQQ